MTIHHLENAIITTTEKTATRQVKRQGHAWTVFWLKLNYFHGIDPRRCNCKQIPLHSPDSVRRKRLELWRRKNWLWLHDNAPAHRSVLVIEGHAWEQVTVLQNPLYSPVSHYAIFFPFLAWKQSYMDLDFNLLFLLRGHDCHKRSPMGPTHFSGSSSTYADVSERA